MVMSVASQSAATDDRTALIRQAFRLEYITLAWMTVEAAVAIGSSLAAPPLRAYSPARLHHRTHQPTGLGASARAHEARARRARDTADGGKPMNLNGGKPWSDMDLADLAQSLTWGAPIEEIAVFLCRDVDEVREKIAALAARLDGCL
jgi:hypothetical protein